MDRSNDQVLGYIERGKCIRYPGLDEVTPVSEEPGAAFFYYGLLLIECKTDEARSSLFKTCRVIDNLDACRFVVLLDKPKDVSFPLVIERGLMGAIASDAEEKDPPSGSWFHFRIHNELVAIHKAIDELRSKLEDKDDNGLDSVRLVLGIAPFQTAIFMSPKERDAYFNCVSPK